MMANICTNRFYLESENIAQWKQTFEDLSLAYYEITFEDESLNFIEGEFCSNWDFPERVLDAIPEGTKDIYFRCLSEEPGDDYFACNVFKNGHWLPEQCFEV
jgi:hypothetical protein